MSCRSWGAAPVTWGSRTESAVAAPNSSATAAVQKGLPLAKKIAASAISPRSFVICFANNAYAKAPARAIEEEGDDRDREIGEVNKESVATEQRADDRDVDND